MGLLWASASLREVFQNSHWTEKHRAMKFTRITIERDKMCGAPCIRGLRFPVATIIGMVAEGMSPEEILKYHPDLEKDDIHQTLQFAAEH
jgi:uncharacterized protein (DUF433 family)